MTMSPLAAGDAWNRVRFEGARKQALEISRSRLVVTGVLFALAFAAISGRLVELTVLKEGGAREMVRVATSPTVRPGRADIVDRQGVLLASSVPTASLYANPRRLLDPAEAADKLLEVLPDLRRDELIKKFNSDRAFVWVRRNLTPNQQFAINALGVPGLNFRRTERRVYPHGRLLAHLVGTTDVDGNGLTGVERSFDGRLASSVEPLALSVDVRVQALMRRELAAAMTKFSAIGAAGTVLDARTGEIVSLVSLPDFEPHHGNSGEGEAAFNRVTKGVYELGSTFKLFTAAMALDSGKAHLKDRYDASKPIKIARFMITDYHAQNRWLTVPEIIVHSSNIGAAKMALDVGTQQQRTYLRAFGLLQPSGVELLEVGAPLIPAPWREINTMTIAYGHGVAVSPLQLATGVAAIANGGVRQQPTVVRRQRGDNPAGVQVISVATSEKLRSLMRLVVQHGTGKNAAVPGYRVGGKTGTAEKSAAGGYSAGRRVISSFVAAFPMDEPRYVVFAMLDEPKGTKETFGYGTGGWVAAPTVSRVIAGMGPILGLAPAAEPELKPAPGDALDIAAVQPQGGGGRRLAAN